MQPKMNFYLLPNMSNLICLKSWTRGGCCWRGNIVHHFHYHTQLQLTLLASLEKYELESLPQIEHNFWHLNVWYIYCQNKNNTTIKLLLAVKCFRSYKKFPPQTEICICYCYVFGASNMSMNGSEYKPAFDTLMLHNTS